MATVTNETEFRSAIASLDPEIVVENDISLNSPTTIGYAVLIRGNPGVSLFWSRPTASSPIMLIVNATGDLVIESIILDAQGRNGTLVQVTGGRFTMNDGCILRNITGNTSQNAVKMGTVVSASRGTFVMNGGLITGVDSSDAVFCGGGTVIMNNDAAIHENMSAGITMTDADNVRAALTMTGRSRVSGNQSKQGASAGIIMGTDIVMGVNEGDAPAVTGNHDPVYSIGGWLLNGCTLIMRYNAEISNNDTVGYGGGIAAYNGTIITMEDNAAVKNNRAGTFGAGLLLGSGSAITMEDQAEISGNVCIGRSGGLELQTRSSLQMKGSAAIYGNAATNGAGIFLFSSTTASIGSDSSSPEIYGNEATEQGGGIYTATGSRLDLSGAANITGNTATEGNGIYKRGVLNLSESPKILDGLFFDDLQTTAPFAPAQADDILPITKFQLPLEASEQILIEPPFLMDLADQKDIRLAPSTLQQTYTDNVPVIVNTLTNSAQIQLESSGHVSPPNVPLVIADKGADYTQLIETDRSAWRIPADFSPGHTVILKDTLDQVLIVFQTYRIFYRNLFGAENPNPEAYDVSNLPITLVNPGERPGYRFAGWNNASGQRVTAIPVGTTGNITLTAVWEELSLSFDGNGSPVCNVPESIPAGPDGKVRIPDAVPCRPCYSFIAWNIPDSGNGRVYFPGDLITVSGDDVRLSAQWQPDCCRCQDKRESTGSFTKCVVSWGD